jgi:nicotinamidase-related amidase
VQNYFVNELTKFIPKKIVKHISKADYDYLVFTKFVNKKGSNFFRLLNWKTMVSGQETEIHNSLIMFVEKNNVFTKNSYSIFKAKDLDNFLNKKNIRELFLCGMDTEACVLASAFEAFDLGYQVKIIKELCFSHSGKSLHNSALKIINQCIG